MSLLKDIPYSFFSPHFYSAAARNGKGIGMAFILALSAIVMLIQALELGWSPDLTAGIKNIPAVVRNLPAMTVKAGKLSIDKPVPYEIRLGDSSFRIVIDTGYKMTDIPALTEKMQHENIVALVTEDAVISRGGNGELKIQDTKKWQDSLIRHDDWGKLADWLEKWGLCIVIVFLAVFCTTGFFIYNLIATFFSAIIVNMMGALASVSLEFDAAMRLAAIARLPASLISLLPFIRPGIGWLIWCAYLVFAVVACRIKPPQQST